MIFLNEKTPKHFHSEVLILDATILLIPPLPLKIAEYQTPRFLCNLNLIIKVIFTRALICTGILGFFFR